MNKLVGDNVEKNCPEYEGCIARRVDDAYMRGNLDAKLLSLQVGIDDIKSKFSEVWTAIDISRNDIKSIYWKVGLLAGTISIVMALVGKLIKD